MGDGGAWALFDDDDEEEEEKCARTRTCYSSSSSRSHAEDGARAGTHRRGTLASAHSYFSGARATWRDVADVDGGGEDGASDEGARCARVVACVALDARSPRARAMADDVRGFAPSGGETARALDALAREAARGDWCAGAREAKGVIRACSRQLSVGNWPSDGFLDAHVMALGCAAAFALAAPEALEDAEDDDGARENDPTASAACRYELWDNDERLARIALELLTASALLRPEKLPSWCGDVIRRVERRFAARTNAKKTTTGDANDFPFGSCIPSELPAKDVPRVDASRGIATERAADLEPPAFYSKYVATETPVVITGHLEREEWGALEIFKTLDVLHAYGDTIVPVEFGTAFESHGTGVTSLAEFARLFLKPSNDAHDGAPASTDVAYVSQHQLFHQVPELCESFTIPPYALGRISPETSAVNIWLGTSGTRTSLHRDPYLNLLCQVAGFKYVRVYDDAQTQYLAPDVLRAGNKNTFTRSPLDPERERSIPSAARFVECILRPGDVLYIPKNHWHYVRSLTTSVSINFWF
jgi:lysine-specific demethylase 8